MGIIYLTGGIYMKKGISILMMVVILNTGIGSYASVENKLGNHWSKNQIELEFLTYYFPYLGRENFKRLDPNGSISNKDITASLGSLGKDYGIEVKFDDLFKDDPITRQGIVIKVGKFLEELNISRDKTKQLPFKDINTMGSSNIELLRLLYDLEIINGVSPTKFGPEKQLSQAEAIIILQRVKGVLKSMEKISFKTMGIMQSYNGQESIKMNDLNDKVMLTITKAFPTPGYSLFVDNITSVKEGYKVFLNSKAPDKDSIQPQVITYKTITIEIDKKQLIKPAPYTFIVEGDNFPSGL